MNDILKTCKINHYIKNLVVIIPLILSTEFLNVKSCLMSLIAFCAFCFASSVVYVMNDIADIKKDRLHPIKCNRAIASGRISKPFALYILFILLTLCILTSLFTNMYCLFTIMGYIILNIVYSLYLKNIPIVDMACIALGFILRIIAGCAVISVKPSPLIIILTFFVSMFFTSAKRKLELQIFEGTNYSRKSLKGVDISTINQLIIANAVLSIAFYFTYMLDKTTMERAGSEYLFWSIIPFTLIVFRLLYLIMTSKITDDTIHFFVNDKILKIMFLFYLIVMGIILILPSK